MALALRAIGFAGVRDGILPSQSNPLRGIAPARPIKIRKPPKGGFVFLVEVAGIEPASEGTPSPALHA